MLIVVSLLKQVRVTLNFKKSKLFTDKIDYLGHLIRPGKLEIAFHTTEAILWIETTEDSNLIEALSRSI